MKSIKQAIEGAFSEIKNTERGFIFMDAIVQDDLPVPPALLTSAELKYFRTEPLKADQKLEPGEIIISSAVGICRGDDKIFRKLIAALDGALREVLDAPAVYPPIMFTDYAGEIRNSVVTRLIIGRPLEAQIPDEYADRIAALTRRNYEELGKAIVNPNVTPPKEIDWDRSREAEAATFMGVRLSNFRLPPKADAAVPTTAEARKSLAFKDDGKPFLGMSLKDFWNIGTGR